MYRDVALRRWRNLLGRTMWESHAYTGDGNRYLVIGLGPQPAAELAQPPEHTELIAYGPLLSDDGVNWSGPRRGIGSLKRGRRAQDHRRKTRTSTSKLHILQAGAVRPDGAGQSRPG